MPDEATTRAAEAVARDSYGRLLAWLATQWRDVQACEDALSDAFLAALDAWPRDGVPAAPDAWLLVAARRRLLEVHRHARVVRAHAADEALEAAIDEGDALAIPDRRLALLLACAHPAIDPSVRAALMLQTVLGLEVARIAPAFLASPAALAQRLVRAKARLRDAGIPFDLPDASVIDERLHAVLEALYAAYGHVHDAGPGADLDPALGGLREELLHLAPLIVELKPANAEALGLLALMHFCEARRDATMTDVFVPMHERDASRWDKARIAAADGLLWRASALRAPGPFQIEAAIQSAHAQRAFTGQVPWRAIATLYAHLLQLAPTVGARVGHAVALANAGEPSAARDALQAIDPRDVREHQPYWVALAHVARGLGDRAREAEALEHAIALTTSEPVRRFLLRRRAVATEG